MDTIAAADAKTNFGALLDKAQHEPVTISKNGRPVAVVISKRAFDEHQALKLQALRQEVARGLADIEQGRLVSGDDAFGQVDRELGGA